MWQFFPGMTQITFPSDRHDGQRIPGIWIKTGLVTCDFGLFETKFGRTGILNMDFSGWIRYVETRVSLYLLSRIIWIRKAKYQSQKAGNWSQDGRDGKNFRFTGFIYAQVQGSRVSLSLPFDWSNWSMIYGSDPLASRSCSTLILQEIENGIRASKRDYTPTWWCKQSLLLFNGPVALWWVSCIQVAFVICQSFSGCARARFHSVYYRWDCKAAHGLSVTRQWSSSVSCIGGVWRSSRHFTVYAWVGRSRSTPTAVQLTITNTDCGWILSPATSPIVSIVTLGGDRTNHTSMAPR